VQVKENKSSKCATFWPETVIFIDISFVCNYKNSE